MLKKVLVSLLIGGLLTSSFALFATEEDEESGFNMGTVRATLRVLGLWDEFGEFLNAIDPTNPLSSGGGSNAGLVSFNTQLLNENPDFEALARLFYAEVHRIDAETIQLRRLRVTENLQSMNGLNGRASLNNVVGDAYTPNLLPGWLWMLAMNYANNDKLLAWHLIGLCGHDDVQDAFELPGRGIALCPEQNSVMYMPRSLGVTVDISQNLKTRITRAQAPTQGARVLPAKYYHVIGAAFTSCLLKRRLNNPLVESQIEGFQRRAVMAYRSSRICRLLEDKSIFLDRGYLNEYREQDPSNSLQYFYDQELFCAHERELNQCSPIHAAAYLTMINPRYRSGNFNNCNQLRAGRSMYNFLGEVMNSTCPRLWTREQCNAAKLRVSTWRVDFDWSIEQHEVGAEFASANCPDLRRGRTGLENAGAALARIRGAQ